MAFLKGLDDDPFVLESLRASNNLETLRCWTGRLFLEKFKVSDPACALELERAAFAAVLKRLRQDYPKDAGSANDSVLVGRYPLDTLAVLNQIHLQAIDWWKNEIVQGVDKDVDARSERFFRFLADPPPLQGTSALGSTYPHLYLVAYEVAMGLLPSVRGSAFGDEELRRLFPHLSEPEQHDFRRRTRQWLALEYASRTVENHLSRERIRKLLLQLRKEKRAIERAIWPENFPEHLTPSAS